MPLVAHSGTVYFFSFSCLNPLSIHVHMSTGSDFELPVEGPYMYINVLKWQH